MRLFNAARVALSAVALCALTACGGGGDGPDYPAEGQIVILSSSPTGAPVGTYNTTDAYSEAYEGGGIEAAYILLDQFAAEIYFSQGDPRKYAILFDDASDGYACRSAALSAEELAYVYPYDEELPVCASTLKIDAARHQLLASNFTIRGLENTNNRVTFSANVSWTLNDK